MQTKKNNMQIVKQHKEIGRQMNHTDRQNFRLDYGRHLLFLSWGPGDTFKKKT